jgi:hypothetical protein
MLVLILFISSLVELPNILLLTFLIFNLNLPHCSPCKSIPGISILSFLISAVLYIDLVSFNIATSSSIFFLIIVCSDVGNEKNDSL